MPFSSLVFKFACFPTSSTDHSYLRSRVVHCPWKGVHRPPTEACPRGILPRLVHSPQTTYQGLFRRPTKACPQAAFQGMSTGHLPKLVCSPLATYPDLSATVHLRRLVCCMLPSKACSPQGTFHGLSTGQHPVNITAWRLSILMYSSYKQIFILSWKDFCSQSFLFCQNWNGRM